MPEPAPPGVVADASGRPAEALTPEAVAGVLADFRDWLTALGSAAEANGVPPPVGEEVDLHTLLGQVLALKQEVNLQTRAVRAQQEQSAETLRQLVLALEERPEAPAGPPPSEDERVRSLLKTLVDLHDALALGGREVRKGEEALGALLDQAAAALTPPASGPAPRPRSFWGRLFGRGDGAEAEREREKAREEAKGRVDRGREALGRVRQSLASLVTGYAMGVQRVERALAQQGLGVMPTVGQAFDPERMEVVDVVTGSGRPSGEVLEEVRRGYLWKGRVFRYAQVRVARG
jgi:molecular chaperone GrpE